MVGKPTKCTIGIQDNSQNTYRKDTILTSIQKRGSYPAKVGLTSYRVDNHDKRKNDEAMRL